MREGAILSGVRFARLTADDLLAIERQPSQRLLLGAAESIERDEAEALADQDDAWSCWRGDRLLACVGINETFPGRQGVAWALLATALGAAHLPLTRFVAGRIAASPLARIEAFARSAVGDPAFDQFPELDSGQKVAIVMAAPSPELRWARRVGLEPAHVLRKFGAASETYVLCERIR